MPIINITMDRGRVHATVSGEAIRMMSDVRKGLNLDSATLETALGKLYSGRNKYEGVMLFGYSVTLIPEEDDIDIAESSRTISLSNDILRNESSITGSYTSSLEHSVTHTVDVTWSSNTQITKGFSIECGTTIKGSGHIDVTTTTGKAVSERMTEVIGSRRQVSVTLCPGKRVNTVLEVKKRHITVTVPFRVEISGHIAACYSNEQPRTVDLRDVLRAAGRRSSHSTEASVEITCFTDADVAMYDV